VSRTSLALIACALTLASAVATAAVPSPAYAADAATGTPTASASDDTPARWIGFYQPGAPQSLGPINAMEAKLGTRVGVINFFRSIEQGFTDKEVDNAADHGATPLITLEFCPAYKSGVVSQPSYSLHNIATNGSKLDGAIRQYAREARDSGHEVWIRPFHEMNGDWYPWSGTKNGNAPDSDSQGRNLEFLAAWRHVHDIFAAEGATNVKFVWCPNVESQPNTAANRVAAYYPGDDYVDYLALDGYNFARTLPKVQWRSFESLFAAPYATLCSLSATKPIFVAETASVSGGGDKAAWISAMFRVIPAKFPRIVGVDWFNSANSRQDWPVDASSSALQAFRLGAANGAYSPGLTLSRVATSLSIKTSAKSGKRKRSVKIYGVLTPGQRADAIRIDVTVPKHGGSHRVIYTNAAASWSLRYTPTVRGTYYLRVSYAGDVTRNAGRSKTIKYVVK
jgi:hypothetical protein